MIGALGYSGVWSGPSDGGETELPFLYISGCEATKASDSTAQISAGEVRDDTDTDDMVVSGVLTANIANTGANGRNVDTAEQSDKWYAVYVIKNPTTGTVASFLINEDDIGGFTFPAGYTLKRRVGWIRNDSSSNFLEFTTYSFGHYRLILWREDLGDRNVLNSGSSSSWADVDCSDWVPPTSRAFLLSHYFDPYSTDDFTLREDGTSVTYAWASESVLGSGGMWTIPCSAAQIIEYDLDSALSDLWLYVMGYMEEV